jgi:hypothetical protein
MPSVGAAFLLLLLAEPPTEPVPLTGRPRSRTLTGQARPLILTGRERPLVLTGKARP